MQPYLSPLAVWALSVGSAIGWGSLFVTGKTYLSLAGPLGSILGLLIGFAMMMMVARLYHFLANRYPGTGGLYNYVKFIFGNDRAFLVAWFLFLIYIAIFWANATSIPLFAHCFVSDALRFGYWYTIFGYEVYLGEAPATLVVIALIALLCMVSKKATAHSMVVMVLIFTVGITICFVAAMAGGGGANLKPAFAADSSALRQVTRIAAGLFILSLAVLLANYRSLCNSRRWARPAATESQPLSGVAAKGLLASRDILWYDGRKERRGSA